MVEAAVIESSWAQWAVLTAAAVPAMQKRAWTIVDPEAANLMSMHRTRVLAARFPEHSRCRPIILARPAIESGDKRWRRPRAPGPATFEPRRKALGRLRIIEGPALMLRLRAGFGVNAKAGLLSVLIGLAGAAADLNVIAAATAYTERAIRTATEEMALAGFIREIEGRPSSFHAEPDPWTHLLQTCRVGGADRRPALPLSKRMRSPPLRFGWTRRP